MNYELTEAGKAKMETCPPHWPFKTQFDFDRNRGWFKSQFKSLRAIAGAEWAKAYQETLREAANAG